MVEKNRRILQQPTNRLITFGCSHTFGHGLPDCIGYKNLPGVYPSKMSWPSLLAKKLKLEVINMAMPGCSNFAILDKILNFTFKQDDIVIVLWSYFERDMIFRTDGVRNHFRTNNKVRIIRKSALDYWPEIHNYYDVRMRSWYYMHHAHLTLIQKVKEFFFLHVNYDKEFMEIRPEFTNNMQFPKTLFDDYLKIPPLALDGLHGGINCHKKFAGDLYKELFRR